MTKEQKRQKRIARVQGRSLKSFHALMSYVWVLFHPLAVFTNFRCFAVIILEFFIVQFFEKFHILRIPVVHVDHPLDKKIPFKPEKVSIYFDFINQWVRPLNMLKQRLGWLRSGTLTRHWMQRFRKLYEYSAQIYHFRLSTTDRPTYKEMREFRQMHALDPHFLCVPSLHVATLALAYGYYRKLFREENFTEEEISRWQPEFYKAAIEITETVLYVKQHSVNCIGAALYVITANFSDIFNEADAHQFIDDLFKTDELDRSVAKEVKDYIRIVYDKFVDEGKSAGHWYEPVRNFLHEYESKTLALS